MTQLKLFKTARATVEASRNEFREILQRKYLFIEEQSPCLKLHLELDGTMSFEISIYHPTIGPKIHKKGFTNSPIPHLPKL